MPTDNPRINVTLSVSLDLLVGRLAAHQRVSKSQVLRELLEEAEPALQRAATLMDMATTASAEARSGLARRIDRDTEHAQDSMAVILGRLDRTTADLVSQAEAVQGKRPARAKRVGGGGAAPSRAAGAAPVRGNPPASNRGVKSSRTGKKAAKAPGRSTKRGAS